MRVLIWLHEPFLAKWTVGELNLHAVTITALKLAGLALFSIVLSFGTWWVLIAYAIISHTPEVRTPGIIIADAIDSGNFDLGEKLLLIWAFDALIYFIVLTAIFIFKRFRANR